MTAFDINDHLSKLQESPYPIENEVLLSELDTAQINDSLNGAFRAVAAGLCLITPLRADRSDCNSERLYRRRDCI